MTDPSSTNPVTMVVDCVDDDCLFKRSCSLSERCFDLLIPATRDLRASVHAIYRYSETFNLEVAGLDLLCGDDALECMICRMWSETFVGLAQSKVRKFLCYLLEENVNILPTPQQLALPEKVREWAMRAKELPQDGSRVAMPDPAHFGI